MVFYKALLRLATPLLFIICFIQEENDRKLWMFSRGVTHIIILYLCKYFAITVFGPGLCGRPENAMHCGMWDRPSHEDKRSGMPSGHSWTAGCFFAVFILSSKTGVVNVYAKLVGIFLAIVVALSRLPPKQVTAYIAATPNGAHTILQILVGFFGGIILEKLLAPNEYLF